jgi:hypothetical protein
MLTALEEAEGHERLLRIMSADGLFIPIRMSVRTPPCRRTNVQSLISWVSDQNKIVLQKTQGWGNLSIVRGVPACLGADRKANRIGDNKPERK